MTDNSNIPTLYRCLMVLVLCISVQSIRAGGLEDGLNAYRQGDYQTAYQTLKPLAERGVAKAQNAIGVLYKNGHGVPKNYEQAIIWYLKSAEGGYVAAYLNLGDIYGALYADVYDAEKAVNWYLRAAEQGRPYAQYKIGQYRRNGIGIEKIIW